MTNFGQRTLFIYFMHNLSNYIIIIIIIIILFKF